jgi:hypothetical protein
LDEAWLLEVVGSGDVYDFTRDVILPSYYCKVGQQAPPKNKTGQKIKTSKSDFPPLFHVLHKKTKD